MGGGKDRGRSRGEEREGKMEGRGRERELQDKKEKGRVWKEGNRGVVRED